VEREEWEIAGIDTGGTFTDTIAIAPDKITVFKIPSTPHNPLDAVIQSTAKLHFVKEVLHGTTVATNAVIERKGAKVALITTKGFADILEIGRQNREDIYALYPTRPEPLVPKKRRFEVSERIIADGSVLIELDKKELTGVLERIKEVNPQSIAICTLFSFLNPSHEEKIANAVEGIAPISLSMEVLPEYREYERTSTTVMDAYVKPLMGDYLKNLDEQLVGSGRTKLFAVMKSARGLARGKTIAKFPVKTLLSGLAGGIRAAEYTSKLLDIPNLISLDIGGTSTDVASIVDGKGGLQQSQKITGLPVAIPAVDVETIGAGGGSLIQLLSGFINVGPESAGADPGPMSYGNGGAIPTVTDADLVYGILPSQLAGGELVLRKDHAIKGLTELSQDLNISLDDTIIGSRRIFHENIAAALASVSTERGLDPRNFRLLAFGGSGPVHGIELAELMGITRVIIPPYPGVWSAVGLLGADFSYDVSKGKIVNWDEISMNNIDALYSKLIEEVHQRANHDDHGENRTISKSLSIRFIGQSFDLTVPYREEKDEIAQGFIQLHLQRYGFAAEDEPLELVALRVNLIIPHDDPKFPILLEKSFPDPKEYRSIIGRNEDVPVYEKDLLGCNFSLEGPVIIDQNDTTTFIPQGWKFDVNKYGFLLVDKTPSA
jgi:N-methylhydantoinase A